MKRKVIQLAGKTLVVSLPNRWARLHGIEKGDELELEEDEKQITIHTGKKKTIEKKEIDISNMGKMARRCIGASYKSGYDEVKITFDDPNLLAIAQNEINTYLIGFEVMEEGSNYCIAKEVSSNKELEFDNILRNTFRNIISIGNDLKLALDEDNKDKLHNISTRDVTINKFTDFCRRSLNKTGYNIQKKTTVIYYIAEELEKIGDCYRDLCKYYSNSNTKATKDITHILQSMNKFFEIIYTLFYELDNKNLSSFYVHKEKISKMIDDHIDKAKKHEIKPLMILHTMKNMIFDLNGSVIIKSL